MVKVVFVFITKFCIDAIYGHIYQINEYEQTDAATMFII